MFDNDALTITHELSGPSTYQLLPAGSRYIVGASIQQSGTASTSEISCGSTVILRNYGKDLPYNQLSFKCDVAVTISKTGQDSAHYVVTYIPRDVSQLRPYQYIEIASGSAIGVGMQGMAYIMWTSFALILLSVAVHMGLIWFERR
jgi:hypothetical protein